MNHMSSFSMDGKRNECYLQKPEGEGHLISRFFHFLRCNVYVGMARNRAQYKDHKSSYLKIEIKTIFDMIIV